MVFGVGMLIERDAQGSGCRRGARGSGFTERRMLGGWDAQSFKTQKGYSNGSGMLGEWDAQRGLLVGRDAGGMFRGKGYRRSVLGIGMQDWCLGVLREGCSRKGCRRDPQESGYRNGVRGLGCSEVGILEGGMVRG